MSKNAGIITGFLLAAIACREASTAPVSFDLGGVDVIQYHFPIAGTVYNPCSPVPEDVALSGTVHVVSKTRGAWATWSTNWDVTGVGLSTGATYVVRDNYHQETLSIPPTGFTQTSEEHLRLVSQGSADNFDLFVTATFSTPPPTVTIGRNRAECRG